METRLRRQFIREARMPPFLIEASCRRGVSPIAQPPRCRNWCCAACAKFFMAHLRSGRKFVAMPSKVVDTAWHEFILHTQRLRELVRRRPFGGFAAPHAPPRCWATGRRNATTACGAAGTGPARKKASTRASLGATAAAVRTRRQVRHSGRLRLRGPTAGPSTRRPTARHAVLRHQFWRLVVVIGRRRCGRCQRLWRQRIERQRCHERHRFQQ
jgi:hypothetical protein